jgi:hypothetical protein
MKAFRALLLGLIVAGAGACSASDYEPGIHNPGYTPGRGRTSYAEAAPATLDTAPQPNARIG